MKRVAAEPAMVNMHTHAATDTPHAATCLGGLWRACGAPFGPHVTKCGWFMLLCQCMPDLKGMKGILPVVEALSHESPDMVAAAAYVLGTAASNNARFQLVRGHRVWGSG